MAITNDTVNFCDENKNLDVSVVGEINGLEIVEDTSDTEDSPKQSSSNAVAAVARPNVPPVFGSVTVSNSENVQFGNNTYFQGPVVIKQIIHNKSGIENVSYDKTDDENVSSPHKKKKDPDVDNDIADSDKFVLKTWHKLTIAVTALVVLISCALVFGIPKGSDGPFDDNSSKLVSGSCHEYSSEFRLVAIVVTPLISAWVSYCLLTMKLRFSFSFLKWHAVNGTAKGKPKVIGAKDDLLIAPNHLRIVSRMEWLAQPATGPLDKLRLPAPWVIISHTATNFCYNQSSCVYNVRLVQEYHIGSRGWYDIGYNFLVGGDGSAYYGRGWDHVGAHTLGYNKYSIGIAFIGTFSQEAPPQKQLDACKKLIDLGVASGKIAKDYKLFAHSQLTAWESPGKKLVEILHEWPHFVKDTSQLETLLPNY
ncbi:peptidoglycan recognition protein 4-like isoform X2 [Leguminivora glycinivorella]|uniref:peptidoglycan recognition protein 4-like isoform X2 n=1 Tax=Leguminivora glycinivorella TaxID=1035111 RepID=UPI00200C1DCB|nr:peptidoglycan recognition protein 4-like isoform X2 [Leguminivora glycinivorella]